MNEAQLRSKIIEARRKVVSSPLVISVSSNGQLSQGAKYAISPKSEQWTPTAIRFLAMDITGEVINAQKPLGNPVERIVVDGTPSKSPLAMNRNITTVFEAGDDVRPVMDQLLAAASKRIPGVTWKWRVTAGAENSSTGLTSQVKSRGPVRLMPGDRIYLVAASDAISGGVDATFGNILFKRGIRADGTGRFKKAGGKRPKGYYAMATADVRAFARRRGVNVRAFHSLKYASDALRRTPPGFPPGSKANSLSQFTGKPKYYQGTWGFALSLSRIRGRR